MKIGLGILAGVTLTGIGLAIGAVFGSYLGVTVTADVLWDNQEHFNEMMRVCNSNLRLVDISAKQEAANG